MICLTKLFQQKRRRIGYILAFSTPTISKRDSSGIFYNIKSSKDLTAEVTNSSEVSYEGDIVIPDEVSFNGKTLKVVAIGIKSFLNSEKLTSVTFGKNVESIEDQAFCNCINLKDINIPHNVKTLGSNSFYGCNALTRITIPKSLTKIHC